MGNQNERRSMIGDNSRKQRHYVHGARAIQRGGRLIGEHDHWLVRQSTYHSGALALPDGYSPRLTPSKMSDAESPEQLSHRSFARLAEQSSRKHGVFLQAQKRNQASSLEDVAEVTCAERPDTRSVVVVPKLADINYGVPVRGDCHSLCLIGAKRHRYQVQACALA